MCNYHLKLNMIMSKDSKHVKLDFGEKNGKQTMDYVFRLFQLIGDQVKNTGTKVCYRKMFLQSSCPTHDLYIVCIGYTRPVCVKPQVII